MVTPPSTMVFFPFNFIGGDLILHVFPSPKIPQMCPNNKQDKSPISISILPPKQPPIDSYFPPPKKTQKSPNSTQCNSNACPSQNKSMGREYLKSRKCNKKVTLNNKPSK
jgi:hypothetical protein